MKKYLLISLTISILCLLVYSFGNEMIFGGRLHPLFPSMVGFSFLQSLIILQIIKLGQKTNWESPLYALGTVSVRLLTSLFFLVLIGLKQVEDMKALAVQFIALYLVYLVFELNAVLANLRRN